MRRRILYSDNSVISDFTVNLNNYASGTHAITIDAANDYIFVGSRLPFNHLFIKMGNVLNTAAGTMSVSYWSDDEFQEAVEVIDETFDNSSTLGKSGYVTWTTDKDEAWTRETTNDDPETVTGLTSVVIYDLYWARLNFSANSTAGIVLSWVGHKFSNDDDLGAEYPDLVRSSVMTAYETGKTDWEEQAILAARIIEQDLISKNIIKGKDQVLDRFDLQLASVSKVAQIIYAGLGDDYVDQMKLAEKDYYSRLHKSLPTVDKNNNARPDESERRTQNGRLFR